MNRLLQGLIACLIFAGSGAVANADDLILANGTSGAAIVIGVNASETEKYAATELQRCIRIMSGTELPIVTSDAPVTGTQIVIGSPAGNSRINDVRSLLHLEGTNDEQTAVVRAGNILYLGGETARAALYATYTFLQDVLGVRWFWPGESGEFIPRRSVVAIGEINIFEVPSIPVRALSITNVTNSNAATDTWEARNKMNMVVVARNSDAESPLIKERLKKGFQTRIAGHFIWLSEEILSAHPEYAALYNGSRSYTTANRAQLCWGNPGVQDEVANLLAEYWAASPFVDVSHFYPADNQTYCTDELCRALAPDVSTRWQKFSQLVMEKVDALYPGRRYWTYAYQGYKDVPDVVASRFENIGYTLYEASYRHLLSSGYSGSAGAIAEIEGWQAKGADVGIRGYEYIMFRDPMFVPLVSWETDQMAWLANKGLTSYLSELPPYNSPANAAPENTYWMCNRMNLYAAAKGLWDATTTADSIVNDWCRTIYGPAADDMIAYYWDIEQLWRNAPGDIQEYNATPASQVDNVFSRADFARLNSYFTQARSKLAGIGDTAARAKIAAQIDLESRMLANWQTVSNFKNNTAGRFQMAIEKADTLDNTTWNSASKLPAFEDLAGEAVAEQTVVSKVWTSSHLNFRIVSQDNDISARVANVTTEDDSTIVNDDCIELFIQPDPGNPAYMYFVVNTNGIKYDAISRFGGTDFDKAWNPDWNVTASLRADGWAVDIHIPFTSLGITAEDSTSFKVALKRSRAGRAENSGWPDATYFNPATFGVATLVSEVPDPVGNRVILFDQGGTSSGNVSTEFQQRGWQVVAGITGEEDLRQKLEEDASVLLLRYSNASTALLSTEFYLNEIQNYIEKGRVVIISTARDIPVDEWFPGTAAVAWSGNNQNISASRSSYQAPGSWKTYPNNLNAEFRNRPTPVTAYIPQAEGWRPLLKMPMRDSTDQPFLLSRRIGNGLLVLTSSNMGYSGGYEVFGNRNITNAVMLTENFRAEQQAFEVIKREQIITVDTVAQKILGEPDFVIAATSSSGLPVTLASSDSSVAIVINGVVHLTGTGTTTITASQSGDETYQPAEVRQELEVIPDAVSPTVPEDLVATATDSTVTLHWTASTDFIGVTGYLIYLDDAYLSTTTATVFEVGGLHSSVTYLLKVVAEDGAGNRSAPASLSVVTPDTQAPGAPLELTAVKAPKHEVALSWLAATDNVGVVGYNLFRNGTQLNASLITATAIRAERPRGKDVYVFTVRAVDAAGNTSVPSNTAISANGKIKDGADGLFGSMISEEEGISVYPNPSTGSFRVNVATRQEGDVLVSVFTPAGHLLRNITWSRNGEQEFEITHLPAGTYIVRVTVDNVSQSRTIMIIK